MAVPMKLAKAMRVTEGGGFAHEYLEHPVLGESAACYFKSRL